MVSGGGDKGGYQDIQVECMLIVDQDVWRELNESLSDKRHAFFSKLTKSRVILLSLLLVFTLWNSNTCLI